MTNILEVKPFLNSMSDILAEILYMETMDIPITLETKLVNGVGTDGMDLSSIDYVDFLARVEYEYNIVYDFNVTIHTIGDIYGYIKEYKAKASTEEDGR